MHYVYILKLGNGQLYTGITDDLTRRYNEHRTGRSPFTSKRLPVKLIFYEAFVNTLDAEKRERYFKTTKGKATLRAMLRNCYSPN
jgi:putative endonuclease